MGACTQLGYIDCSLLLVNSLSLSSLFLPPPSSPADISATRFLSGQGTTTACMVCCLWGLFSLTGSHQHTPNVCQGIAIVDCVTKEVGSWKGGVSTGNLGEGASCIVTQGGLNFPCSHTDTDMCNFFLFTV